jgi:hypothetical protein
VGARGKPFWGFPRRVGALWASTAPAASMGGASLVGDARDGQHQTEIGFLRIGQSEAVRGELGNPRGEYNILLNVGGVDDASMQPGLGFECDRITKMNPALLASLASLLATAGGVPSSRLVSPNGQWWAQVQDDENFGAGEALSRGSRNLMSRS